MENENHARRRDISGKEQDIAKLGGEAKKVHKTKEGTAKKIEGVDQERADYERERDELRARINSLTTMEIRTEWKQGEMQKKQIDDLKVRARTRVTPVRGFGSALEVRREHTVRFGARARFAARSPVAGRAVSTPNGFGSARARGSPRARRSPVG